MIAEKGTGDLLSLRPARATWKRRRSAAQDLDQFLELEPHLMNQLLALVEIDLRIVAREPVSGSANGEALLIQQAADLANDEHVLPLIIAAVAAALHRLQLWEFLLPIAQHMRLDPAQIADFANGEVALAGNRRQFAVIAWFQHTPRRGPSISGPDGM